MMFTVSGYFWWDLLGVAFLLFVILFSVFGIRSLNEKQSRLEEKLTDLYLQDVFTEEECDSRNALFAECSDEEN